MLNRRIILSSLSILASTALVVGATFALFTDEEISEGNTFTAGSLDLKVDYECYYNMTPDQGDPNCPDHMQQPEEGDLGPGFKFFDFDDLKPGDFGEGTISLHVIDNDAWGRLVIDNLEDPENECTDAEVEAGDTSCGEGVHDGELRENLMFSMWLDQGSQPGFQGKDVDAEEGDNIRQEATEPTIISEGTIDQGGEEHVAAEALAGVYSAAGCNGDGSVESDCPGMTADGHMVGSITYYLGVAWYLPGEIGDGVQTDSLEADITFAVEQYRHNEVPSPSPI